MVTVSDDRRPTLVLVHGAWHGAWCWRELEAELLTSSWAVTTVELPSALRVQPHTEPLPGLYDDVRVIRDALSDVGGPVVVVAHSYGGVPVTQAIGDAPNVVGVVYLAALMLDSGESVFSSAGMVEPESLSGALPVVPEPHAAYFADLSEDRADWAVSQLVPQSVRSFGERVTQAGWRDIASAYIVCTKDRALSFEQQQAFASRADTVRRIESGHSPFLSMPRELAALVSELAMRSA
jgi:pimeloyl-ACP methyl ester carboxylesterase